MLLNLGPAVLPRMEGSAVVAESNGTVAAGGITETDFGWATWRCPCAWEVPGRMGERARHQVLTVHLLRCLRHNHLPSFFPFH